MSEDLFGCQKMSDRIKVAKDDYELLETCIKTEQVPANDIVQYFSDTDFYNWFKERNFNNDIS